MKKTALILVAMIMVLTLALTACSGGGGTQEPAAEPQTSQPAAVDPATATPSADVPQKLVFATKSVPTIDPQYFNASPSYVTIKGFAEGLVHTWQGQVNPGVAESWEIAEDNMSMTFHLRQDAKWSDGTPLTANDFVYAFQRLADPAEPKDYNWVLYEITNYADIAEGNKPLEDLGVAAPDDYTFVITFETPAPYYLGFLDMPCFYPTKQEWVEQYGTEYASSADKILGNGPYKLTDYRVEESITMVPNENYWNKDAIKLEEVTIRIMDDETAFALFEAGELDWAYIPPAIAPNYLGGNMPEGATAYTYKSGAVDWFCINMANPDKPYLANLDFRLALNYALDREEYIAISSSGLYTPATRFVLPTVSGLDGYYCDEYPINVFQPTAELDKAQEHLQKAMDTLGITDPSQISIAIKVADTTPKAIAENCQDQWNRTLGINVTIDTVTYPAMIADRKSGDFDLVYAGWMPDYDDPYTYLGYFVSTNPQNGGKYNNPKYDELVNTANSYADPATRLSMYAEAEELLISEAGIVPLQVREVPAAIRNNLKNFVHFYLAMEQDYIYAFYE